MTKQKRGVFRRLIDEFEENPIKFWFFDLPFVLMAVGLIIYWLLQ